MRKSKREHGLVAHAVAGTHVVLLGWDVLDPKVKKGLRGFAIQRTDHTEHETYWLRGMKTFPGTAPLAPGDNASSHGQPYQSFQWGDYTAKAEHDYTYRIFPMYGAPTQLVDGDPVEVRVTTESQWGKPHSIFFNRGAVASQEYARRFRNRKPSAIGEPAYSWLSRGLLEALIAFIRRAEGRSFGLRCAFYEFQWKDVTARANALAGEVADVLNELRVAADERDVDVQVLYDAIENAKRDPVAKNDAAIAGAKIKGVCDRFTDGKLMHNKFVVLTKNDEPVAVWTGSTNITENGLFGHLNCGHVVEDGAVAGQYLEYWHELRRDPGSKALRKWNDAATPAPANPPPAGTVEVFSPQTGSSTLTRYAEIAGSAKRALFMTFAFGMNGAFQRVYEQDDGVLRFALMEKAGNGANMEQGKKDIARIRKLRNVLVAIGHNITVNEFDRWLQEVSSAVTKANVHWVHTKFMLVDPLSDDPVVVTGSGNFSDASITTNEENMLVIRGDRRVADIYLGEFMRSFAHYAFREAVYRDHQRGERADEWQPQHLSTDPTWLNDYWVRGSDRELRRLYFSGQ